MTMLVGCRARSAALTPMQLLCRRAAVMAAAAVL
jgi:hypothetical protein